MAGPAPVSVVILARSAGPAAARAIAAAQAHAKETLLVASSASAARQLQVDHPSVCVCHKTFRNPAEALAGVETRYALRLWYWAEELPDEHAWAYVTRIARSPSTESHAFALSQLRNGHRITCAAPDRPALRLWHGEAVTLATGASGFAVVAAGVRSRRAEGGIIHYGFGDATHRVARTNYEIGCAVHAAIDGGLSTPPAAFGAAGLARGWIAGWLSSGLRRPTDRMVATFLDRFWVPMLLNARLREATGELARQGRAGWLAAHHEFSGATE